MPTMIDDEVVSAEAWRTGASAPDRKAERRAWANGNTPSPGPEFRILGQLEVVHEGRRLELGGRRQRGVLALLLLDANRVISTDRLADQLWAGQPPLRAAGTLQAYVSRLRRVLDPDHPAPTLAGLLATRPTGYVLQVAADQIDAGRFERLTEQGRAALAAGEPAVALDRLDQALALWRGPALADLAGEPFAGPAVHRLEELRLGATEDRLEAALALGRHGSIVADLESLVASHPLRERPWGQLMLALYRSERQAESLRAYQAARHVLGEELGLDPGPALRALEQAILRHDPSLAWQSPPLSTPPLIPGRSDAPKPTPARADLVGRALELADLEGELERSAAGEFRCVLLLGDPGMGKTRLAQEFSARHQAVGLAARAYELGETASFGLWAEALERHLRTVPADEISDLCGGFLDDLAGLCRSVAAVRGSAPQCDAPRLRLLQGLAAVLASLATRDPVVVVLDDVHLADDSSWQALHYLARNLSDVRLLVIAAARPAELANHRVAAEVVLGLEQDGLLHRVSLSPLAQQSVRHLAGTVLGEPPSAALVDWLAERSRGNALFALSLVQALVDEGADLSAPELRSLPEALRDRVARRVTHLGEAALETLELLAVLGRRVELDDMVHLTGRNLEALEVVVSELLRSRLVGQDERGNEVTYEVAHPLIQDIIYEGIGRPRRRVVHRQVARALMTSGRFGEAAAHFARSAAAGDAEAIDAVRRALQQAEEREAYGEALSILGALVDLLKPDDGRWLEVAETLSHRAEWVYRGGSRALIGSRALRAIDSALEGSTDARTRAAIKLRLANLLAWGTGELDDAERSAACALELFQEAGESAKALLAANELAWVRGLKGDVAGWQEGARRVVRAARAGDEQFVLMHGLASVGISSFMRGRFAEAERTLRAGARIAREVGKLPALAMILSSLGVSLALEGRLEEALVLLEEGRSANPGCQERVLVEWELIVQWLAGRIPAGLAGADDALARNPGTSKRWGIGMLFAALSAAETDQMARAEQYLARGRAARGHRDWLLCADYHAYAEAVIAGRDRVDPESIVVLRRVASNFLAKDVPIFAAFVLVDLAEMAAPVDEVAAGDAAAQLEEIARRTDRDFYRALSGIASAWAGLASDDPGGARQQAREAARLLSPIGYPLFRGRALDVLGRACAFHDGEAAREAFEEAESTFGACGATRRRQRAAEARQQLTAANPGSRVRT